MLVGRGIAVLHQREVDADPGREAHQLEVPVKPPARVLLPEQDQQQRRQHDQACSADGAGELLAAAVGVAAALEQGEHDRDRDDHEQAEERRQAVQRPVG